MTIIEHVRRPFLIKSLDQDGIFTGYASVFGAVDSQSEVVERGAFARSLAEMRSSGRAPAMLWMHDPSLPIGIWVEMREDAKGLYVEGRLALSTQKGREAYELLKMGALTGLSIGYRVVRSGIDKVRKARLLLDVELFEISLVTFPANDRARVEAVKSPRTARGGKASVKGRQAAGTRAVCAPLHRAARVLRGGKATVTKTTKTKTGR